MEKKTERAKRHEEVENLQKDVLRKHDAQIQDYKDLSEENEYLKKLNNSLCDAIVESNEGGGLNHDG